jgi:hypothetical protein
MTTICTGLSLVGALLAAQSQPVADVPLPPPPAGTKQLPAAAASPGSTDKPLLFVADLAAQGVPVAEAAAVTDALVTALSSRGLFRVVSSKEVAQMLGVERQRQLLGVCEANEGACAGNVAEATGARFVLSGSLSLLGPTYQLSLQMLDTVKGQPVGRASRLSADLGVLRAQVPYAVAEATGVPLPPPPSRVLQVSMIAVGGAAAVGGAFTGLLALSRQTVLNEELCPGATKGAGCAGVNLRPRAYYVEQNQALTTQKFLSVGLMAGGALLAAAGVWLLPAPEGGPRVALVPGPGGVVVAGVWP